MDWNDGGGPWGSNSSESKKKFNRQNQRKGMPPNLDDLIRAAQDYLKKMFPPGKGNGQLILWVFLILIGLWMSTGVYRVQPNEQGVVLRFGKMVRIAQSGLNYHLPYPVERVIIKDVTAVNRIDSGTLLSQVRDGTEESLMLTGDENIVEVNFTVLWVIKDIEQYLFNAKSPDETVKSAAESVVREIIAQTPIASALTQGRSDINQKAQVMLQALVDEYKLGIHIQEVLMGKIDPPAAVIDAYRDVQRAKADQERARNEAESYRNSVVPVARGEAQKVIQEASGYRQRVIAIAQGNTNRFTALLTEYLQAPDIIAQRLYIETLGDVLEGVPKIIMDSSQKVLPYLPLPELKKMKPSATTDTGEAS